ncbi:MAG: hypothetical protein ACN6OP_15895 [Pseudomonadales bacterium]
MTFFVLRLRTIGVAGDIGLRAPLKGGLAEVPVIQTGQLDQKLPERARFKVEADVSAKQILFGSKLRIRRED